MFYTSITFSQTFSWNENNISLENENTYNVAHLFYNNIYKIRTGYNQKKFNKDILVEIYDPKDDFEKESLDISIEQPAMGLNMMTVFDVFNLQERDLIYFIDYYDKATKNLELLWLKVNIDTGKKTKEKFITSIPGKSSLSPGSFDVAQSPKKNFYGVIKIVSADRKGKQKIILSLLNEQLNIVKEKELVLDYLEKEIYSYDISVSDEGVIYLFYDIDIAKQKPYKNLTVWNTSLDVVNSTSLKIENDFQFHQFKGEYHENNFFLLGLFTDRRTLMSQMGMRDSKALGETCFGYTLFKFDINGNLVYKNQHNIEKKNNLNCKDIVFKDGSIWCFFDGLYHNAKNRPMQAGTTEIIFDYTYHNYFFEICTLKETDGSILWNNNIKLNHTPTVNDNGNTLSYLYFFSSDELVLLFNTVYTPNNRQVIYHRYNKKGEKIDQKNLSVLPSFFALDTSFATLLENNKYLVRCMNGNSCRYGFLDLN